MNLVANVAEGSLIKWAACRGVLECWSSTSEFGVLELCCSTSDLQQEGTAMLQLAAQPQLWWRPGHGSHAVGCISA